MREILFKGKRADNGKWEVGCLIILPNGDCEIGNRCINPPDGDPIWEKSIITHKVDPSTICQYTGLTDKNGNKIWENDIVYIPYERIEDSYCKVIFRRGGFIGEMADGCEDCLINRKVEVIGNIFDNPELLREE